jgi:DNA-directed RNA polymerase beta' subunit
MKINLKKYPNVFFSEKNKITSCKPVQKDSFSENGIFSERIFGSMEKRAKASCKCGELEGNFHSGEICKVCGTEVSSHDSSLNKIGWIDLKYDFINPVMFPFLKRAFNTKELNLDKIINFHLQLNEDGEIIENKNPYENIGIIEFNKKFDEIFCYFENINKKKYKKTFDFIKKNRSQIFINKLIVFNIVLRPAMLLGNRLVFDEINIHYGNIIFNLDSVKIDISPDRIAPILFTVQTELNSIFIKIVNFISGKNGIIRNSLLGFRVNFSARTVIVPSANVSIDEVEMPYIAFMELFQFHIINIIRRAENLSFNNAKKRWNEAQLKFDKKIYDLVTKEIKTPVYILFNRNPTINVGSILCLKIKNIKPDISDLTMGISNNILPLISGDYDGDTLNTIPLMDNGLKKTFLKLSPINMLVDTNSGKFNSNLSLDRDHILGLWEWLH